MNQVTKSKIGIFALALLATRLQAGVIGRAFGGQAR